VLAYRGRERVAFIHELPRRVIFSETQGYEKSRSS
jgi:hypothetical protein